MGHVSVVAGNIHPLKELTWKMETSQNISAFQGVHVQVPW